MSEYERWQTRYESPDYVFGEAPNAFLESQRALLPKSGTALAVADGEGRNGVWLARQGLTVTSTEFSPNAQTKARALADRHGVAPHFVLADVHEWDYPESAFDVVVDIFSQFSNPAQRARKWAGMIRALEPGGLLLVEGYTPKQLDYGTGGPKVVENLYTREMLETAFACLSKVEIRAYEAELSEGGGHSGMSAVIDLVGWK
jgi:SAM-dependent methyltransferase